MKDTSLPPVTNRPLYVYRIFIKAFSFFVWGAATLFLAFPLMPVLFLVIRPLEKLQRFIRRLVSGWFKVFILMMKTLGIVILETDDTETFRHLQSKIVVSNHPSLLDIVMLFSLIPNADVIVRGALQKNIIFAGVIPKLYILNSLDFNDIVAAAKESLARGNCLVIFPEGTRTPRHEKIRLKKGAARLSVMCNAEIVTAYIGGTDKYGLGKNDPFLSFNHRDKYIYRITIQKTLSPEKYAGMETYRAVRRLNAEILELLENPIRT